MSDEQRRATRSQTKTLQPQPSGNTAPTMASNDDIMAMLNSMSKDHALMAKDVSDLKSANQTLTDKVAVLERSSVSPSGRRRHFQDASEPPPSDSEGNQKEKDKPISAAFTSEKDRFRVEELGYFDGTGDVYAFADRLQTLGTIKSIKLVKDHLVLCFMNPAGSNEAYNWWTSELSNTARKALLSHTEMVLLCDTLKSRFGIPEHQLLEQLNQIRYTRKDAADQKPATAFVGQVMTLAKRLDYDQKSGLQMAFTKFEAPLQSTLPFPGTDMDLFMSQVQIRQTAWFEQYRYHGKSTPSTYSASTASNATSQQFSNPQQFDRDKRSNNSYGRNRAPYQYRGGYRGNSDQKLLPAPTANVRFAEPDDTGPFHYIPDDDVPEYAEANFGDAGTRYDGHDVINKDGHRWRAHKFPRDE